MIQKSKRGAALRAVHQVVLKGRLMAYAEESHQKIARLLDDTEYLIALMYEPKDTTGTFERYLAKVSKTFACEYALTVYNQASDS